ncbi:M4 family metallopeptidase, partial [Nocardioides hankookensis]
DPTVAARGVWRFEVTRGADERRQVMVDDRTGAVLMDVDEVQHAVDRVVCDNANVRRGSDIPCTSGFARTEGGSATGQADVDTAYDLSGVVADFYQQVAGVDITQLLGVTVSGQKKFASTVRWCYTGASNACPYDNAFWNGSQMYYGQGYAVADDVVGHEITHGFTERNSGLFYWGQSGAMNESMSDIIGEIIDHRHGAESDADWDLGEDIPGFPNGIRNMADPTVFSDPDKTSSGFYKIEGSTYPDNDGVHTNSGVGNKTAFLISQGGTFNGQTMTGIDAGDPTLTKSARLWILVDQSLTSGSDYADEGAVLDQSCQALLAAGTAGFTAADCTNVHKATLATELLTTPTNNPQPADATAECPVGTVKRVLLDSETGTPESTFVAGSTWTRGASVSHTGPDAWLSDDPSTVGTSSLVASTAVALPAGQPAYLFFQQWRVLDYDTNGFYDAGTVEVDAGSGPVDTASLPWVNGPSQTISSGFSNPAAGRLGFGGDSRGYVASRVDLTSFAGTSVKPRFTMNTDSSVSFPGWAVDDVSLYTCDPPAIAGSVAPTVSGTPAVGATLTATAGTWTPTPDSFTYQWLRDGVPIVGATQATYTPTTADGGHLIAVAVTGVKDGFASTSTTSAAVSIPAPVEPGEKTLTTAVPTLSGTFAVGSKVTAAPGAWKAGTAPVTSFSYQWLRNGVPVAGATSPTYAVTAADARTRLSVQVTGSYPTYTTATALSASHVVAA